MLSRIYERVEFIACRTRGKGKKKKYYCQVECVAYKQCPQITEGQMVCIMKLAKKNLLNENLCAPSTSIQFYRSINPVLIHNKFIYLLNQQRNVYEINKKKTLRERKRK